MVLSMLLHTGGETGQGIKIYSVCGISVQELSTTQRRYVNTTDPSAVRNDIFACRLQYTSFCCTAGFLIHGVTMLLCTVFCMATLTWPVVALGHPDGAGTMWLV